MNSKLIFKLILNFKSEVSVKTDAIKKKKNSNTCP